MRTHLCAICEFRFGQSEFRCVMHVLACVVSFAVLVWFVCVFRVAVLVRGALCVQRLAIINYE